MNRRMIISAALGAVVGVLVAFVAFKATEGVRRYRSEYGDWRKLNLVLDVIGRNYVDTVDFEKVSNAAIEAALSSLDPHSVYMPPQELEESEDDLAGEFGGIGIQFNVPADTAVVIEVIPGGPSEKIGVLAGDRILEVDGRNIAGVKFPQDSMVRAMRGPAGTKVAIKVKRSADVILFDITRDKIPTHSIDAAFMVSDSTAYLKLGKFSRTTVVEVATKLIALSAEGMTGLVLDLRQNSGGFFDQALALSNLFLPKDAPIVYLEGRTRSREDFKANGKGMFQDLRMCLLIDEGSASSSEIFAGAMQDNGRAVIIGRRSFGKGLVQEPFNFTDGSGIRLTVSRFFTPSGRVIQKPYSDDYGYEVFQRYGTGEMMDADSIKADSGGIIPDVFVPVDTTGVGPFYTACYRKATTMRFASAYVDTHRWELAAVGSFEELQRYLASSSLESEFLRYAKSVDGLAPSASEWSREKVYVTAQVEALVGRYSKLGDNAYYHLYLPVDKVFNKALEEITGR